MKTYTVYWEMEIEAESPVDAARQALVIHRDPNSIATVFDVVGSRGGLTRVDLTEEDERITDVRNGGADHG